MTIIVPDCDFRDECETCLFCDCNDDTCERTLGYIKTTGKREDCPIKSVEELIKKIMNLDYLTIEDGSDGYDRYVDLDNVVQVIKEYCEVNK